MLGPQCSPGPCGQQRARGTLNEALSSVLEGAPLGASGPASFPFIRHCENIPLCIYFLLSHLFVCLLIILLLEQNMQWIRRSGFCRKLRGLCHRSGWPSQAQEDGTWKELTSSFHLHRLWNCLEVQEHLSHQGRAATLELQEEASQSQRRQRSPTMNLIFSFMGPFPGPQAPDPTGPAVLPWIQVALPWPSRSLKHGKSACHIGSSLRSGLIHIEGREALSNTNPRIYSAQKGAK